jgi:hypothetical protein
MKFSNLLYTSTLLLVSSLFWLSSAFAALGHNELPNLIGLTVAEAEAKYGVGSGYDHPLVIEVNNRSGSKKCITIGPDCSTACPTAKIYHKLSHFPNHDGTNTVRVNVHFDINQTVNSRAPSC